MKVHLQSTLIVLLVILSSASSFGQQKSYLGTPPPAGAKLYLDGSNASLQQNWTYWNVHDWRQLLPSNGQK